MNEAEAIFGNSVKIISEGKRHLGAVIGSKEYKDEYCEQLVSVWEDELDTLAKIAKSQPQAAYIALTKAYRSKFTYFMRTIDSFEEYVSPVDTLLNEKFVPIIFGEDTPFEQPFMDLLSLSPTNGGLGIPSLKNDSALQHETSKAVTENHVNSIISQSVVMLQGETPVDAIKKEYQVKKKATIKQRIEIVDNALPVETLRSVQQGRDKGASSWLNAIPFEDKGLYLNKQEFRDSLRLRYNIRLKDLPSKCACGEPFSVDHALICKKGGFVAQRHDNIKNLLVSSLAKVCKNVESEPHLQPLDNETFTFRTANTSEEARLDIKAGGFWSKGVNAFFDVRVSHINSPSNQNRTTKQIFKSHEQEKKRFYNQRILDVEQGNFTPLVFGTNGGIGEEGNRFLRRLSELLSVKENETYAHIMTWLRTKLSFEILKSVHLSVRGARTPFKKTVVNNEVVEDFALNVINAGL